MVYRKFRKTPRARRPVFRKKKFLRKTPMYRTMKPKLNNEFGVLNVKCRTQSTRTIATGAALTESWSPSFSDLPAAELAAYQALYDQVKVCALKVVYLPRGNQAGMAASVNSFRMYSVVDRTDSSSLATIAEAMQYNNCYSTLLTKPHKRYTTLSQVHLIKDSNNNPLLTVNKPRWLQTNAQVIGGTTYDDTIVDHLGIKVITDLNPLGTSVVFDVFITTYLQFKVRK